MHPVAAVRQHPNLAFSNSTDLQAHYKKHHRDRAPPPASEHTLKQHVYDYLANQARHNNYAMLSQRGNPKPILSGAQLVHQFWTQDLGARAREYNAAVETVRSRGMEPTEASADRCSESEASVSDSKDSFVVSDDESESTENSDDTDYEHEAEALVWLNCHVRHQGQDGVVMGYDFDDKRFTVVFERGRCLWTEHKVSKYRVRARGKPARTKPPRIAVLRDLGQEEAAPRKRRRVWQVASETESEA